MDNNIYVLIYILWYLYILLIWYVKKDKVNYCVLDVWYDWIVI